MTMTWPARAAALAIAALAIPLVIGMVLAIVGAARAAAGCRLELAALPEVPGIVAEVWRCPDVG